MNFFIVQTISINSILIKQCNTYLFNRFHRNNSNTFLHWDDMKNLRKWEHIKFIVKIHNLNKKCYNIDLIAQQILRCVFSKLSDQFLYKSYQDKIFVRMFLSKYPKCFCLRMFLDHQFSKEFMWQKGFEIIILTEFCEFASWG